MPISNVTLAGNNWYKHGEVVHLKVRLFLRVSKIPGWFQVKCGGTGPFWFCFQTRNGTYNATGHEKCREADGKSVCEFAYQRYFRFVRYFFASIFISLSYRQSGTYTVVFVASNGLANTLVKTFSITIYDGRSRILFF